MLGLPWPAWGETDVLLAMARRIVDKSLCPCGCGQPVDTSTDASTAGRWQASVDECYARAALEEFREKHGADLPPGALVGVKLLPEGEQVKNPMEFDADEARREHAAMRERFGLD